MPFALTNPGQTPRHAAQEAHSALPLRPVVSRPLAWIMAVWRLPVQPGTILFGGAVNSNTSPSPTTAPKVWFPSSPYSHYPGTGLPSTRILHHRLQQRRRSGFHRRHTAIILARGCRQLEYFTIAYNSAEGLVSI